jgi:hypothetical protein
MLQAISTTVKLVVTVVLHTWRLVLLFSKSLVFSAAISDLVSLVYSTLDGEFTWVIVIDRH